MDTHVKQRLWDNLSRDRFWRRRRLGDRPDGTDDGKAVGRLGDRVVCESKSEGVEGGQSSCRN